MGSTLYLQFKKSAECFPNNACLIDHKLNLSYEQAESLIDSMAYHLHTAGVTSHDVVALYGDKSADCMIVFFALSKLGATCLTLDLAFPKSMISYVLDDASVKFVISNKDFPISTTLPVLATHDLLSATRGESPVAINGHIAWLVYSSGTTGNPKGVKISSSAMVSSIHAREQFSHYEPTDRVACNIYFYWEAFRPLFFGASLYVINDDLLFNLSAYADFIFQQKISETLWTPSFAEMLFSNLNKSELEKINALKRVWFNGEVVKSTLSTDALKWLPNVECYNLYSISETFDVSAKLMSGDISNECASIGLPLPGVQTWVLNEAGEPCLDYEVGELYLYSASLADGYLNREQAQKESFVHIDGALTKALCYRTKDRAFKSAEGEIFILGRNDHVVKLRGYNVSLMSIENTLKQSLAIKNCMVMLEGAEAVSQILVAVIEPENYEGFIKQFEVETHVGLSQKLQAYLSSFLPAYSIPTKFVIRHSLTLDPYSAKLDRKKILNEYSDDKLVAIWQGILMLDAHAITPESDFYELGANSLQAIQLMQKIKNIFNFDLTIEQLDKHSKLNLLRKLVTSCNNSDEKQLINYQEDITFNYDRKPENNTVSNLSQAKKVLITGVTGFLGAHWLESCLKETKADYYCLIRANDEAHGLARLESVFKKYKLDATLLTDRIHIIMGCLTKPKLGLAAPVWQRLSTEIDVILHAAAFVNLLFSYQKLKPSIVEGGRSMLTLATTAKIKPIVIISSDAVFPLNNQQNREAFLEDNSINALTYGYAQAKWVQEKLLSNVFNAYNIPFLLFRLGNLAPSTNHGVLNVDDANHHFCRAVKKLKTIPEKCLLEFSPVDRVVSFLMQQSLAAIDANILSLNDINHLNSMQIKSLMSSWHLEAVSQTQWLELLERNEPELYALWNIKELFSDKIVDNGFENALLKLSQEDNQRILESLATPISTHLASEEN